jgi:hypothetical protein
MAFMHARFIQQGRVDTVWTVLGAFGYGEDLELKEEVLRPKSVWYFLSISNLASYAFKSIPN